MFEIFSKLRPGTSLMPLYGTLHQLRRMEIYESFCRKQSAVLFATDLAARGLDFPEVHWVVQADCPEDAATYIHRVGRTARYHRGGESMILLLNSEVKMVERLEEKKIPINKTDINPMKLNNPVRKIEAFLAKDPTLKDSAQRAFVSYAKAVFLMKDKEIFNVQALDTDSYAHSLGLAIPPRIRFLQRLNARQEQHKNIKNKDIPIVFNKEISSNTKKIYFDDDEKVNNKEDIRYSDDEIVNNEEEESESEEKTEDRTEKLISKSPKKKQNKVKEKPREKLREKPVLKNEDKFEKITSEDSGVSDDEETFKRITKQQEKSTPFHVSDDSDDDDDILQVKRKDHDIELPTDQEMAVLHLGRGGKKKPVTKAALVKKLTKKKIVCNKKTFFDDEGEAVTSGTREKKSELAQEYENADEGGIDFEKAKLILKEEDKFDKQLFKEKVKAKHKEEKRKLKEQKKLERDQEKDEFGESDSEEEPDLSWLPDPDKIYGKRNSDEEDPEFYEPTPNDEETEKSEETVKKSKKESKTKTKKRKLKGNMDNLETVLKKKKKQKIEQISSSLSVNEAEELAMMLLSKK